MIVFAYDEFTKANRSTSNEDVTNCVRVARRAGVVELRDDKVEFNSSADHRLRFTDEQFDAFQDALRAGVSEGGCLQITQREDGLYEFRSATDTEATVLVFDHSEVEAFYAGVEEHNWPTPIAA